jgi:hypothetical protein
LHFLALSFEITVKIMILYTFFGKTAGWFRRGLYWHFDTRLERGTRSCGGGKTKKGARIGRAPRSFTMKKEIFRHCGALAALLMSILVLAGCPDPNNETELNTGPVKTLESITVASSPTKTVYMAGEGFSGAGLVVRAGYSDGSAVPVTGYTLTWNGSSLAEGSASITAGTGEKIR